MYDISGNLNSSITLILNDNIFVMIIYSQLQIKNPVLDVSAWIFILWGCFLWIFIFVMKVFLFLFLYEKWLFNLI